MYPILNIIFLVKLHESDGKCAENALQLLRAVQRIRCSLFLWLINELKKKMEEERKVGCKGYMHKEKQGDK